VVKDWRRRNFAVNQLFNTRELRAYRYRTGVMRERERLRKGRKIHVYFGNRWRSSRKSGRGNFFHSLNSLIFLVMVDGRCH
jgi:hypothetical protein